MVYIKTWVVNFVGVDVSTFSDLAEFLEDRIEDLKSMEADGLTICLCNIDTGLIRFMTDDKDMAEKYSMESPEDFEAMYDNHKTRDSEDDYFDDSDFNDDEDDDDEHDHWCKGDNGTVPSY